MAPRLWTRWKLLAHKAAEVQGQVLFFLLYFFVLVPLAIVRSPAAVFGRRPVAAPRWHARVDTSTADLPGARRQF